MIVRKLPAHLRAKRNRERLKNLRRTANRLAGFYGVPVYLCGSALLDFNEQPRDWDIRATLSDEDFKRRFGSPERWETEGNTGKWTLLRWKWSDRMCKDSRVESAITGLNMDVQIYPKRYARHFRRHPRLRLDTRSVR